MIQLRGVSNCSSSGGGNSIINSSGSTSGSSICTKTYMYIEFQAVKI